MGKTEIKMAIPSPAPYHRIIEMPINPETVNPFLKKKPCKHEHVSRGKCMHCDRKINPITGEAM